MVLPTKKSKNIRNLKLISDGSTKEVTQDEPWNAAAICVNTSDNGHLFRYSFLAVWQACNSFNASLSFWISKIANCLFFSIFLINCSKQRHLNLEKNCVSNETALVNAYGSLKFKSNTECFWFRAFFVCIRFSRRRVLSIHSFCTY